ncbi:VC0807 family protein [Gluconacetobacter takamatsuzukensis]|uniref:VC0807 family protein n=1 Tax=Gluconacetobacter takamatsuzukensis TaxID=1286190 RepID=UPI00160095FB|nr:VC0807 family protein [Gluconacetobacter takamatsuzukensis]
MNSLRPRIPGLALLALDLAVNFAAPALIYDRMQAAWGDVDALLASSMPPLLWSIGGFLRNRRVDALSLLSLAGIALSLLAFLGGGSARMLELREKMVTFLIGLAFLGSAAIGKPLVAALARATVARESAQALADFDAHRNTPGMRRAIMVMTLVWGAGLLADVAVSVVLIYSLPIATYLVVGPILGYVTMGGLALWTVAYRRYRMHYRAPGPPRPRTRTRWTDRNPRPTGTFFKQHLNDSLILEREPDRPPSATGTAR